MVAVFHRVGTPSEDKMCHSLEQILDYEGQVTFDGAYLSVWDNREALAKLNPILFVQGNTINTKGVCTYSQILEMEDIGFQLGWHGYTHRRLPSLSDDELAKELNPPNEFRRYYAYPHGEFDERCRDVIRNKSIFFQAFSTTQGDDDDFSLKREYV